MFTLSMNSRAVGSATGIGLVLLSAIEACGLEVRVLDSEKCKPLAGVSVLCRVGDAKVSTLVCDAAGKVKVSVPARAAGPVQVTASKDGFAPMTMRWDAGKVPVRFDLLLPEAQTIGGRVTDQAGRPVTGAAIGIIVPQRLAGPFVAVADLGVKSDADGRWRCHAVPKDAAYVFVEVSHSEFDSPSGEVSLQALRAATAEFKLYPVATVRGRVLDGAGRGVPGAELMLGSERDIWPSRSTLESRTDADGTFEFQRVRLEKRLLGIHAPALAPTLELVEIKRDAAPMEIRLKAGSPLRVRVVDHAGQPIAGVAASVDQWPSGLHNGRERLPGRWAYPGWEWETDTEGRIVWANAPAEVAAWSFRKGGHMHRGSHGLQPGTNEQIVTLGLPFRLSGKVADAATSKPITEFILTPRLAQISSFNGNTRTNFGRWSEYDRKPFSNGEFNFYRESPLIQGSRQMHDWQFRVEADGFEPAVSRLVRDEERGARLDFQLTPRPLPEIVVPNPTGTKRVTAGAAVQPSVARPGDTLTLFVKARIAAGHHVYALEDSGCRNLPTSLEASLRGVLTPDGPWQGPEPKTHDDGSRTLAGDVLLKRRFLVTDSTGLKAHKLPVKLRFQVCNDALCWPPETIALETEFQLVTSPE